MLTKDQILAALDLKTEAVEVPEWGGPVNIRSMTGLERDSFTSALRDDKGVVSMDNYRAKLLVVCIVGEDGKALFTPDDLTALGGKSSAAIDRVFVVAERLNYMGGDAVDAAAKN